MIVGELGGTITIDSDTGAGARVTVVVPLRRPEEHPARRVGDVDV